MPEAYVLAGPFALEESEAWARGRAMGQSRASMLPARALAPEPGERILDLCAAPGAKATHLAALAANGARVTAVELRPARAEALRALARRLGARVEVVVADARTVALEGTFDAALVDPPCTGLGVLAARPDARWRRREEAVAPLVELQSAVLARALERRAARRARRLLDLHPAGPGERGGGRRPRARRSTTSDPALPGLAHPRLPGALLTLPGRDGTDGFFVARMGA